MTVVYSVNLAYESAGVDGSFSRCKVGIKTLVGHERRETDRYQSLPRKEQIRSCPPRLMGHKRLRAYVPNV